MQQCLCCGGALVPWPADVGCEFGACDGACLPSCQPADIQVLEVSGRNDGQPWRLGILNPDCSCDGEVRCESEVLAEGTVQLRVELCATFDRSCECAPAYAECEIPFLGSGEWRVVDDEARDVFGPIEIYDPDVSIEQEPPRWQSPTLGSQHFEEMLWPPTSTTTRSVCFTTGELVSAEVEVCGSCAHSVIGACATALWEDQLYITTSDQSPRVTDAIDCDECSWRRRSCGRPVAAGTYNVVVDGIDRGTFALGEEVVCLE